MFKVLILERLLNSKIANVVKCSRDWDELTLDEQRVYLKKHPGSRRTLTAKPSDKFRELKDGDDEDFKNFKMTLPQVQNSLKTFQTTGSQAEFEKLQDNFMPMIGAAIKRVIGSRYPSREDLEDIKQMAQLIFVDTLGRADPNNPGLFNYLKITLNNHLKSEVRKVFRRTVTMEPTDRKKLRIIQKYIHNHPDDRYPNLEQMARDINADPNLKITVTPGEISNLLTSEAISLESEVSDADEKSRTLHEVIGPEQISTDIPPEDLPAESPFYDTPEQQVIKARTSDEVLKAISELGDPLREQLIKMTYGLTVEGKPMSIGEISNEFESKGQRIPRSTIRRELERAEVQLQKNPRLKKLRTAVNILLLKKAMDKNLRFVYVPETIVKIGSAYIVDEKYKVSKFASQLVCDCGEKNCYHKEAIRNLN